MISIVEIKQQIGSKVTLEEVSELYPEVGKREISKALKDAGWVSKVIWNEAHTKSSRKWCEPTEADREKKAAKGLRASATIYDVMIAAIENGIDPTNILTKLQELEAEKESQPETEFQECMNVFRELWKVAVANTKTNGPSNEPSERQMVFCKSVLLVWLVENLYPQLQEKQTYRNYVAKMERLAPEVYTDWYFDNHVLGMVYKREPIIKEAMKWAREKYRPQMLDNLEEVEL